MLHSPWGHKHSLCPQLVRLRTVPLPSMTRLWQSSPSTQWSALASWQSLHQRTFLASPRRAATRALWTPVTLPPRLQSWTKAAPWRSLRSAQVGHGHPGQGKLGQARRSGQRRLHWMRRAAAAPCPLHPAVSPRQRPGEQLLPVHSREISRPEPRIQARSPLPSPLAVACRLATVEAGWPACG